MLSQAFALACDWISSAASQPHRQEDPDVEFRPQLAASRNEWATMTQSPSEKKSQSSSVGKFLDKYDSVYCDPIEVSGLQSSC